MSTMEILGFALGLTVRQWRHADEYFGGEEPGVTRQIFWTDFAFRWLVGGILMAILAANPDALTKLLENLGIEGFTISGLIGGLGLGLAVDQIILKLAESRFLPKTEEVKPVIDGARDRILANLFSSKIKATAAEKDEIDELIGAVSDFALKATKFKKLLPKSKFEEFSRLLHEAAGFSETFISNYNKADRDRLKMKLDEILKALQ